jgi:hypothetical protein
MIVRLLAYLEWNSSVCPGSGGNECVMAVKCISTYKKASRGPVLRCWVESPPSLLRSCAKTEGGSSGEDGGVPAIL